jgi:hypothetical protein
VYELHVEHKFVGVIVDVRVFVGVTVGVFVGV